MLHVRKPRRVNHNNGGGRMKNLSTILLAGALALAASAAFAQVRLGGHGSTGGVSAGNSGRIGTGANAGANRGGASVGVGGHADGSSRLTTGIGSSRVNGAISGQNRIRGNARTR
jgi:hypothetical protein